MKRKITAITFICFLVFPTLTFAGEYIITKGKGVEVCEAYGEKINSMKLKVPHRCERKFNLWCEGKCNPCFKEFSKPEWEIIYDFTEDNQKLFNNINLFLWERDANPIYHFTVSEWKDWRGTPEQYLRVWESYKQGRWAHLLLGLPVSKVDIDNDGEIENISYSGVCQGVYGSVLLVLNDDRTAIDLKKSALVLQHPSHKEKGKGELTADGKAVKDALHYLFYNVFIYDQKTYFDLWEEAEEFKHDSSWGELKVFFIENKKAREICRYEFKQ